MATLFGPDPPLPGTVRPIDSHVIASAAGIKTEGLCFDGLGDVYAVHAGNILSYLKDVKYADALNRNGHIAGVLCTGQTAEAVSSRKAKIVCDDPTFAFFALVDYLARHKPQLPSVIRSDTGSTLCFIAPHDVFVGRDVVIEPFAVLHPGTHVGDGVVIRSGAVLGLDSFQHQRTTRGLISPRHDGVLVVEDGAEIGAGAALSKGFSYRATRIGRACKLDAHVYVGHGAEIGAETIVCAGAKIMGHVRLGEKSLIGPGAVVSSRVVAGREARVSPGAVVTRAIEDGQWVSGNFAVPHDRHIAFVKSL